jgi:uncharacterized membrane protein YdjX (TVP38/TMEM64 family)
VAHEEHLTYYIIFLRITPFLPNWLINIVSPVIGVGLFSFFVGTFFGVFCWPEVSASNAVN